MEQTIQVVPLQQIYENGSNPRSRIDSETIKDLAENIRIHGLLNPLLLRPGKKNQYEIVAGHRRFNALKILQLKEVNCIVRNLSDEEAFELAVIENLQREDVHPLDEAQTFATILKKSTVEELAKKINKSESYIAKRLKLNDLIEPVKKLFYSGDLELAHCIQICRLSNEQQKHCLQQLTSSAYNGKTHVKCFRSPVELQVFIQREIYQSLSAAPFKRNDADLYPKAGACINCPKRTGANKTLFNDIDKDDQCLDKTCYQTKTVNFVMRKAKELTDEGIEFKYIYNGNSYQLGQIYKGIEMHDDYNFTKVNKEQKNSMIGLCLDGKQVGQTVHIVSRFSKEYSNLNRQSSELSPKEQIKKINERLSRAIELDRSKVYAQILPFFDPDNFSNDDDPEVKKLFVKWYSDDKIVKNQPELSELENELFIYAMFNREQMSATMFDDIIFDGEFDNVDNENNKISKMIRALDESTLRQAKRVVLASNIFPRNAQLIERDAYIYNSIVDLALHYNPVETQRILDEQKVKREKREKNAAAKIKALQEESKNKAAKSKKKSK